MRTVVICTSMSRRHGPQKETLVTNRDLKYIKIDDIIHTPPVYSMTCQSLRTYEQPKGRIPPKAVLFFCSYL